MPSSSARCAQLPRAADKVPFYAALKKFRDYLNGVITEIDESEMVFTEPRVKSCYEAEPKPDPYATELTDISNAVIKKEDGTIVPCKKKRGRPKKIKIEGEETPPKPVTVRKSPSIQQQNNCDFPKKKRGRPKKVKVDNMDVPPPENNTSTNNMNQRYPSPNHFYPMNPSITPPNTSGNLYAPQAQTYTQSPRPPYSQSPRPPYSQSPRPPYSQSPRPPYSQSPRPPYSQSPRPPYSQSPRPPYSQSPRPPYSQSPRPHSQPFTHSDLSSEISAAISSEQLGSPASPSLGPPDFDPPTSMADEPECRLGSPAPSTNSEQAHYGYHPYNMDAGHDGGQQYNSPRQPQDIASKSLSGLYLLLAYKNWGLSMSKCFWQVDVYVLKTAQPSRTCCSVGRCALKVFLRYNSKVIWKV